MDRFSKRCLRICLLAAIPFLPAPWCAGASDPEAQTLEILRNNQVLRSYFSRQAIETNSFVDNFGRRQYRGSAEQLERHTDRLIEHFHQRLVKNLEELESGFRDARRARTEWLSAPEGTVERRVLWSRSRRALDEVAGRAGDLRRLLSFPLVSLDSRDDYEPEITRESAYGGFEREFSFLEREMAHAVEEIKDYFLTPTHTVSVRDLQSPNMMIHLHRVRQMARALSRIDPPEPAS